jgi:hypothetical protein
MASSCSCPCERGSGKVASEGWCPAPDVAGHLAAAAATSAGKELHAAVAVLVEVEVKQPAVEVVAGCLEALVDPLHGLSAAGCGCGGVAWRCVALHPPALLEQLTADGVPSEEASEPPPPSRPHHTTSSSHARSLSFSSAQPAPFPPHRSTHATRAPTTHDTQAACPAPVAQKVEHSVFHRGGVGSYPTRSNHSFFLSGSVPRPPAPAPAC